MVVRRYTTTEELFVKHMEDKANMPISETGAPMGLWLGLIAAALSWLRVARGNSASVDLRWISADRETVPSADWVQQPRIWATKEARVLHADYKTGSDDNLGAPRFTFLCPLLITEKNLGNAFRMEEVSIPLVFLFVGDEDVQHAEAGSNGKHALRYQNILILQGCSLEDAVAFSYGCSLAHPEALLSGGTGDKDFL